MAALYHGSITSTTPGTAVPLAPANGPAVFAQWILFQPRVLNDTPNVGEVRIGGTPLAADAGAIPSGSGIRLKPGDAAVMWPMWTYDLRNIYLDVDTSGDGVQYAYAIA